MHLHHHSSSTSLSLPSYQKLRTIFIILCVVIVVVQVYILSQVISSTFRTLEDDVDKTRKAWQHGQEGLAQLKKGASDAFKKLDDTIDHSMKDVIAAEDRLIHRSKRTGEDDDGDDTAKRKHQRGGHDEEKKPITRDLLSPLSSDDSDEEKSLNKFLSSHPNIHTRPLNEVQRKIFSKQFSAPPSTLDDDSGHQHYSHLSPASSSPDAPPSEAQQLLDLYSDIEPSSRDAAFVDNFLLKRLHFIRPETALLLKKVQALNEQMRNQRRSSSASKVKKRVVIVHPVGQLCNRLVSIASAFIFSVLSRRALFVDDSDFYCQLSDLFLKPGFEWTSNSGDNDLGHEDAFRDPILENPEQGPWVMAEPLLCTNYTQHARTPKSPPHFAFDDHSTVVIRTNQYLVPYMQRNPFYRKALEYFFPTSKGGIFHVIAHFLFRPLPELLQQRDEYVRQHFEGNFVVGLQVRAGGDFTENSMKDSDWNLYADCGRAAAAGAGAASTTASTKKKKSVKFFVATDTAAGRDQARQVLGSENVLFSPGPFLLSNNPKGVQMALLDLLLLEMADDRVATAWSTFGYFAAGRAGVPSNLVCDKVPDDEVEAKMERHEIQRYMGVKHKSDKRRQCVRLPTAQPCFHHFENWGASKTSCAEKNWLKEEMMNGRYC